MNKPQCILIKNEGFEGVLAKDYQATIPSVIAKYINIEMLYMCKVFRHLASLPEADAAASEAIQLQGDPSACSKPPVDLKMRFAP